MYQHYKLNLFTKLLACLCLFAYDGIAQPLELSFLGRYSTGTYDAGGTEIAAYDPASKRLFSVNGSTGSVDIINVANPGNPTLVSSLSLAAYGAAANSVAAKNGIIAIAVEAVVKQDPGKVVFIDANGTVLNSVTVGALPDMVCFSPNGKYVLTANEGEPNSAYTVDPEGSVSIINISGGVGTATVATAGFTSFNGTTLPYGIRKFGPGATVAKDLEPEYITVSSNSQTAWVTCQENNCWAIIDIPTATVTSLVPMGFKDHSISGNGLDASDQNGGVVNIATWPIKGMYQPDAIASFVVNGQTYLISANEGDARAYTGFSEESRISSSSFVLDPVKFPNAATLKNNSNLGRLNVTNKSGDIDADGDIDTIYVYGARSISIWNDAGQLLWDSGDELEQKMLQFNPTNFNCSNVNNTKKNRSDDKGPEPEAVTVATIGDSLFAFVGLERIGGVMIYNITNPTSPYFVSYLNTRNFAQTPGLNSGGDLGPEGILFIPAIESPNKRDMLVVSNEISGTVALYTIGRAMTLQVLHGSDFEASLDGVQDAPRFAAIIDTLEHTHVNTLTLSSGDNMIPSPFSSAGEDPSMVAQYKNTMINFYGGTFANNDLRAGIGRADISIMNFMGIEASALGNHEFDWGTSELRNMIAGLNSGSNIRWFGAQFPYLSANLDFSGDVNLSNISTNARLSNTAFRSNPSMSASAIASTPKLAPSCTITKNGEKYGIFGATTPILASISSPGSTSVKNPGAGTNDMAQLASILQPVIDSLRFAEGCNKIILLAHMQQIAFEKQLATFLNGVDIIIGGGSNTIMADANDRLRTGDVAAETYPYFTLGADGKPTVIVNTDGNYRYVGRLVIGFDAGGNIIPGSVDPLMSGIYPADSLGIEETYGTGNYTNAFAAGSRGAQVKTICDAINTVIVAKDGNLFGKTSVFLEGRRNFVRTEETNLGNLSAEANLWMARFYDASTTISIKNGGGIRSVIGYVNAVGSTVTLEPPLANPSAGKAQGDISQLDIENSLRFNNQLSLLTLTASGLRSVLEHGVKATAPGATPGQFPQIAGVRFSYDPTLPQNVRILSAVITDSAGNNLDTLVMNGQLVGDPNRTFRVVTLNFLAGGGDSYPFNTLGSNRVDLNTQPAAGPGLASFAGAGSEQDAFAEYMKVNYSTTPYSVSETPATVDSKIENLTIRTDDILRLTITSATSTTAVCDTPGTITLEFKGGAGPYALAVNGVASASNIVSPYTLSGLQSGNYILTITDYYGISASDTIEVNAGQGPGDAGSISGQISACLGGGNGSRIFSIQPVANATSYVWSWNGPAGSSISSGNGTNSVTVSWTDSAIQSGINGALTVTPANNCSQNGSSSSVQLEYQVAAPVTPASISGPGKLCPGDNATYSVASLSRATQYNWIMPSGILITSAGSGGNIIHAAVQGGFSGGVLTLTASNVCGTSSVRTKSTVQNLPITPAAIQGVKSGLCNTAGALFSVPAVSNASEYTWSTSHGVIASGQGTTAISVSPGSFSTGTVTVRSKNGCGSSNLRSTSISGFPARPEPITGTTTPCGGSVEQYSIPTVNGSVNYNWTVSGGGVIQSGQGSKDIQVSWGTFPQLNQSLRVTASNDCGNSTSRSLNTITVSNCARNAGVRSGWQVYPNPASDIITIQINEPSVNRARVVLMDVSGRILNETLNTVGQGGDIVLSVSEIPSGIYTLRIEAGSIIEIVRLSVN